MKSFPQTLMLVFLLVAGVCGQHGNHVAPETAASIRLLDTRGFVHKQVSTTNVEAQKYFDQGLTLMYAYNRWDAAKSFKRAAELDPTLAIAWWGVAETMFTRSTERPDRVASMKEAREAIERAMALKAPPSERVYIEATWKLFSTAEKSDQKVLDANYAAAMKKIYQSSPDDPDAAVLYHWSRSSIKPDESWKRNGTPSPWTREGDRILEDGMKLHPRHLGLNHEYIHHVESSPSPERALRSADLLRSFKLSEPELGHLVHMPAHIYIRVGDFQKAAESNQEAARNVNAQMSSDFKYWHFAHVYQFLRLSYYMQGNYEKLRLNDMVAFDHQYPNATADEKKRRGFDLTMISRFRRWKDVLEFQLPDKPIANMYYQRAFALAATGKVAEAEAEQAKWFAACKCGIR